MFILQEIRNKKKLSRRELAELSGVAEITIQFLELNTNDPMKAKLDTLIKLATALNCKVKDLFPNEKHIG